MSNLRLNQKRPETLSGYAHSDSVRKYLLRNNLILARYLHELSPEGAEAIIRKHRSKQRIQAARKMIVWTMLFVGIGVSWVLFDLPQKISAFSLPQMVDALSTPKDRFRIKSSEEKEIESRLKALIVKPIGLEEDFLLRDFD